MLTADDRIHSDGRLRADEAEMLGILLDAAESAPQYVASLADRDEGRDLKKLETQLRERLARSSDRHSPVFRPPLPVFRPPLPVFRPPLPRSSDRHSRSSDRHSRSSDRHSRS